MKKSNILSERRELKKAAGLMPEDSDYDMGTPSGDTDAMNIAEREKLMKAAGLFKEDDFDLPDENPFDEKQGIYIYGTDGDYIIRINDVNSYQEFQQKVNHLRNVNPTFNDMFRHFSHTEEISDIGWAKDATHDIHPGDDIPYDFDFDEWVEFELDSYDPADYSHLDENDFELPDESPFEKIKQDEEEEVLRIVQDNYSLSDAVQEFLGWDQEDAYGADPTDWDAIVSVIMNNPMLKAQILS